MNKLLDQTVGVIHLLEFDLSFTILEIGALKLSENDEPFYKILDYFPSSKIYGFELDRNVCDQLNSNAGSGVKYFPHALGERSESRKLNITNHPMCSSLYEPNEEFLDLYQNLDVAKKKSEVTINTISLDQFIEDNGVTSVDFIKIDVQGAEGDIFKGAPKTLKNTLNIVCEVGFVPLYKEQPLFGDICTILSRHGFMFNKFLGMAGRSLKPIVLKNNPNFASQHMWSDAVFIKHVAMIPGLANDKILKLALLAATYSSADLVHYCLMTFDKKNETSLSDKWMRAMSK